MQDILQSYARIYVAFDHAEKPLAILTLADEAIEADVEKFVGHLPGYLRHAHAPKWLQEQLAQRADDIQKRVQQHRISERDAAIGILGEVFSSLQGLPRHTVKQQSPRKKADSEAARREAKRKAYYAAHKPVQVKDPRRKRIQELEAEIARLREELEAESQERVLQTTFDRKHRRTDEHPEPVWGRNRGEHVLQTEIT